MNERVEPEWAMVTVLFIDIRGFTTFADRSTAREAVAYLNEFFGVVVPILTAHGGHANKLLGDGLLGVFGAPDHCPDHADRALAAAEQMNGPALESFNAMLRERGDEPFRIGIGLNSGPVMAGNVGSQRRMEYSAIGDTTNTAARLETMTKGSGHSIFLSDSTRGMLTRPRGDLVHVAEMEVRGKDAPVTVWSVT